jgi:hypothetical protein
LTSVIYAIGRDDFVELRRAKRPPKLISQMLTKTQKVHWTSRYEPCQQADENAVPVYYYPDGSYSRRRITGYQRLVKVYRDETDRVRIVTVRGGRRLGLPIKKRLFSKWTGHSLSDGTIWPLPEKMGQEVVKRVKQIQKR